MGEEKEKVCPYFMMVMMTIPESMRKDYHNIEVKCLGILCGRYKACQGHFTGHITEGM